MSVLLGVGDKSLSKALKDILEKQGYENVEETYHIDYLAEKVSYEQPKIVILHEHLQSNCLTHAEKEEEILSLIEHWRMAYNDTIRVVVICIRERNDPFLGNLIAHNVLDIFPDKKVPVKDLLNQLNAPPNFSNVKKLATTKLKIELDETIEIEEGSEGEPILEESSHNYEEDGPILEDDIQQPIRANSKNTSKSEKEYGKKIGETAAKATSFVKNVSEKIPKIEMSSQSESERTELLFDDLMDLLSPASTAEEIIPASVIGTVLIGVAGVKGHLGSTHTAISTARFLAKSGHSVVVIECNNSKDFDRIHSLYQGEKDFLERDTYFKIDGVHHYKYRPNFDLNKLYASYEYVIMDYGDLQTAMNYTDEFHRAHVRLVVCSGDEWKVHWIDQFLKINKLEKADCTFVIPNASKAKADDLKEQIRYEDVYAFPGQDDPYKIKQETGQLMEGLLGEYLHRQMPGSSKFIKKSTVVIAIILSIIATAILFTIFTYL